MQRIIILLLAFISGCASYSPSINESVEGKTAVYTIGVEQAKRIVFATMNSHFAGREVLPLGSPAIGYTTYTRMILDTWSTTVTIVPVVAKAGSRVTDALKIDIRGSGSSFLTGRVLFEGFKERLAHELANTGAVLQADSYSIQ